MKIGIRNTAFALLLMIAAGPAISGSVKEEEAQLRDAYGQYRIALFATNSGDRELTKKAMTSLATKWQALATEWSQTPPPQYVDDPLLGQTLSTVSEVIAAAGEEVAAGKLAEAHEKLERIREELGTLHIRNGLFTFSDRMNAYHARMEEMFGRDYASAGEDARIELAGDVAVLSYLAGDLAAHPAPEADDPAFGALLEDLLGSVEAVRSALEAGDMTKAQEAVGKLKMSYAKLFAKFG